MENQLDGRAVAHVLRGLLDVAPAPGALPAILQQLVDTAKTVLVADGIGLLLADANGPPGSLVTTDAVAVARAMADAAKACGRTTVACFMGRERGDEGRRLLQEASVPVYRFLEEAAAALAAMCRYRYFRERKTGRAHAGRGNPRAYRDR